MGLLIQCLCVAFTCSGKTQDLEEQQPSVEQELRRLMEKPGVCPTPSSPPPGSNVWNEAIFFFRLFWAEHLKSAWHRKREEELMNKLMEIVNDRNAIVEGLDEDRLR